MYLKSGIDYYLLNLKELTITCKSGNVLVSPNLKFNSSSTNVYSTEESVLVDRLTFMAKKLREL